MQTMDTLQHERYWQPWLMKMNQGYANSLRPQECDTLAKLKAQMVWIA